MYKDNVSPSNTIDEISKKEISGGNFDIYEFIFLFVSATSFFRFFPTQYTKNIYYILVIMKK